MGIQHCRANHKWSAPFVFRTVRTRVRYLDGICQRRQITGFLGEAR